MGKITDGWQIDDPDWMAGHGEYPKTRRRTAHKGDIGSMTVQFGQANGQSRLTEAEVGEIFRMAETMRQYEIAKHFEISEAHVSRILNGKAWLHGSAQRKMTDYLNERNDNHG
jgi:hypothetical protein